MKFTELKKGVKVFDRWWPEWGAGFVVKKLKTKVIILFANMKVYSYDVAHVKYLAKVK